MELLTAIVYKFIMVMVMDLSSLHYSFWVWITLVADLPSYFSSLPPQILYSSVGLCWAYFYVDGLKNPHLMVP